MSPTYMSMSCLRIYGTQNSIHLQPELAMISLSEKCAKQDAIIFIKEGCLLKDDNAKLLNYYQKCAPCLHIQYPQ